MAFRCYVQKEKIEPKSRFYRCFVVYGGKEYYLTLGSIRNPTFVFIGEKPYPVQEVWEDGKNLKKYVDVKKGGSLTDH